MRSFVGLDCGGTASRVLAVDESGEPVFRGQSGAANLLSTPEATIERNLRRAVAGCPPATTVCGAFAGLVGPDEHGRAVRLLTELFPGAEIRAEPDYAAAHAAAPTGTIVTVIAGTGSLVCGPDAQGRLAKSGGGGYLLGDEGSGFRYGRAVVAEYVRHPQAASQATLAALEAHFATWETARIVAALYAAPAPQAALARLLSAFATDLNAGAAYAEAIAAREALELAGVVSEHLSLHHPTRHVVRVSLAGGVWKASDRFETLFADTLRADSPGVTFSIARLTRPPVEGAVALAREHDGNGK